MKYVLDTNIVTRLLKGDERVLGHLTDVEPRDVGIPLLVLAELLFGAEKSVRKEQIRIAPAVTFPASIRGVISNGRVRVCGTATYDECPSWWG